MTRVAGVDGAKGGWAVVTLDGPHAGLRRLARLEDLFALPGEFDIVAVDIPIGLLDAYERGGRRCDNAARRALGPRGGSVFPAPVRPVLRAASYEEACARSRQSSPLRTALSQQAYGLLPKIEEVDDLLRSRPDLKNTVREVHPELSFQALAGAPMAHAKSTAEGRADRLRALAQVFPRLDDLLAAGRAERLHAVDVLDAAAACCSAARLARGAAYSLPADVPTDSAGLPMAIWV